MKRSIIVVVILAALVGGGVYYMKRDGTGANAAGTGGGANQGRGGAQGGFGGPGGFGGFGGGFGFGGGPRMPMTVELAAVKRADMIETMTVVGNLIGAATVEAVPKVSGRL